MYLADDHFRKRGVRGRSKIIYASGTPGIFSVKEFAKTLNEVIARKGIETLYKHKLVEIRPSEQQGDLPEHRGRGSDGDRVRDDPHHPAAGSARRDQG